MSDYVNTLNRIMAIQIIAGPKPRLPSTPAPIITPRKFRLDD